MVEHASNLTLGKAEARGLWVSSQHQLHCETLCEKPERGRERPNITFQSLFHFDWNQLLKNRF
jgi:hypothetical protein